MHSSKPHIPASSAGADIKEARSKPTRSRTPLVNRSLIATNEAAVHLNVSAARVSLPGAGFCVIEWHYTHKSCEVHNGIREWDSREWTN